MEGSGTAALSVVNVKFDAVNVGIASRPLAPVRFNIRARILRSAVLSFKSVENTSRGKSRPLVEVDEKACAWRRDLSRDQIGGITSPKRRPRIVVIVERLQDDDVQVARRKVSGLTSLANRYAVPDAKDRRVEGKRRRWQG